MKNYKFIVDASHGGTDTGVTGNNIVEKDFSLNISEYIYNKLKDLGYDVEITRTNDELLSNEDRIDRILKFYGGSNDVIIISNHLSDSTNGVEIIYALRNNSKLADSIADEMKSDVIEVSKVYQRRLPSDTAKDYYFIHRDTLNTIPLLISYGNVNSIDADDLKNYQKYGDAVVNGIKSFLGDIDITNTYIVKSGDSLWSVAKKFDVSVEELKKANSLNSNLLNVGDTLKIPQVQTPPEFGDFVVYTVKSGDNLYSIARKYDLTVDDIVDYNDLVNANLSIGQQLLIPAPKMKENNIYIVKSGDSLYGIASKYGISVTELKNYNNLNSNVLQIGQQLKIPGFKNENSSYLEYIVQRGDSLYSIARRYNTTVSDIMKLNKLNTNLLNIGDVLKIPTSGNEITYTVKSGDNLYNIASKYNTTVDELKRKNNLSSNLLNIGQILII